jgi:hypothetical protein
MENWKPNKLNPRVLQKQKNQPCKLFFFLQWVKSFSWWCHCPSPHQDMAMGSHLTCFSWLLKIGLQSQSSNNNKNRTHNSKNSFPWTSSLSSLGPSLSLQNWRTGKKTQQTEPKSFAEAKTNYACKAFFTSFFSSKSFLFSWYCHGPSPHHNSTFFPRPTTLKTEHSKIIKKMERTKPRERERERERAPPCCHTWLRTAGKSQMECIAAEEEEQKQIVLVLGGHFLTLCTTHLHL